MKCKKCLHYEVCVKLGKPSLYGINQEIGCSAYKDKEKWEEKKETITNADSIRSLSDEELAEWIARTQIAVTKGVMNLLRIPYDEPDGLVENGKTEVLQWLKQPVGGE